MQANNSLPQLLTLYDSFQRCLETIGRQEPALSLNDKAWQLCLQNDGNGPLCAQKAYIPIDERIKRIFVPPSPHSDFYAIMADIKRSFSLLHVDYLTQEDKIKLSELESLVNRVGACVYTKKSKHLLWPFAPVSHSFSDYQVKSPIPPVLIAKCQEITTPLKNFDKRCWLNSACVYMASGSFYDPYLKMPWPGNADNSVRMALVRAINGLRRGMPTIVVSELISELRQNLKGSSFGGFELGIQDADEFLALIQSRCTVDAQMNAQSMELYESDNPLVQKRAQAKTGMRSLRIDHGDDHEIDIPRALRFKGAVDNVKSYHLYLDGDYVEIESDQGRTFFTERFFTFLPDDLELVVRRATEYIAPEANPQNMATIRLNNDHSIDLIEYRFNEEIGVMVPCHEVRYRIIASIVRTKERHFYANERRDGIVAIHDDTKIFEVDSPQAFSNSYLVQLKLVSRKAIARK